MTLFAAPNVIQCASGSVRMWFRVVKPGGMDPRGLLMEQNL